MMIGMLFSFLLFVWFLTEKWPLVEKKTKYAYEYHGQCRWNWNSRGVLLSLWASMFMRMQMGYSSHLWRLLTNHLWFIHLWISSKLTFSFLFLFFCFFVKLTKNPSKLGIVSYTNIQTTIIFLIAAHNFHKWTKPTNWKTTVTLNPS